MKHWRDLLSRRLTFGLVAALCATIQIGSASWLVRDFTAPNASTALARHLASHGTLSVDAWRQLRGPGSTVPAVGLRAYHRPGEPLYLAVGLRVTPAAWHAFLHLPVVLLLVLSITSIAWSLGGAATAVAAGLIACVDPFLVRHGPVWDDTFLAAALTWFVLAICIEGLRTDRRVGRLRVLLVGTAAGCAVLTRPEAGVVCLLAGLLALLPAARRIRPLGGAAVIGGVVAAGGWAVRNLLVLGVLFFGTSHDGKTLYESNYAYARESLIETGSVSSFSQTHIGDLYASVDHLDEVAADRRFRQAAWAYITGHPLEVARTAAVKIAVSLTGRDPSEPWDTVRNVIAVGFNLLLMALALVGTPRLARQVPSGGLRSYASRVALVIGAVTMATLALGPAGLRYRMLVAGLFYLGAAGLAASDVPWARWAVPRRSTA